MSSVRDGEEPETGKKKSGSVSRVLSLVASGERRSFNLTNCYQLALLFSKRPTPLLRPGPSNSVLGLAGGGVYHAGTVTNSAVRFYRTISPLPVPQQVEAIGCVFSVALSRGLPRVAVSHHRALSCSDFPLI